MKYVTLDTGLKGAAVLWEDARPIEGYAFKQKGVGIDVRELCDILLEWCPDRIIIEIFPPQPYQGVAQTSKQWRVIGQIEAVCSIYCDEIEYVYVATWTSFTKRLSVNPTLQNKKISQELTAKYFPEFAAKYMKRKLFHDGIADCLCIGIYINRDDYIDDL